eukprot:TRINITY_DN33405_c0_g1_i1.p1 TRINITY_DN33405_c0_g1~~TRINITY_DN33405_c0_g1_i1.p1  ORF type:complete len:257 (+),score=63.12 TRINITY_DN33405_c0_g1_i1:238-1008(+)
MAFVWNRSFSAFEKPEAAFLPEGCPLENLAEFAARGADLIVEVAHPDITKEWGPRFIQHANYLMGSPTVMADQPTNDAIRKLATDPTGFGVYVPAGALWGGEDIGKMADSGKLSALIVRMKKHPVSLKLGGDLGEVLAGYSPGSGELVVYQGPLRPLCPLAPNNVNTMACAAIAGHTVGFDQLEAVLVADDSLEAHVVEIEAFGNMRPDGTQLVVKTQRINPAAPGAVTGTATLDSFVSSVVRAGRIPLGDGVHLC